MKFMANELKQDGAPARVMEWALASRSKSPVFAVPQKKPGVVLA
jgi:hypothetical protein